MTALFATAMRPARDSGPMPFMILILAIHLALCFAHAGQQPTSTSLREASTINVPSPRHPRAAMETSAFDRTSLDIGPQHMRNVVTNEQELHAFEQKYWSRVRQCTILIDERKRFRKLTLHFRAAPN